MENAVLVEAEWLHECARSAKRDGVPKFDGGSWLCSRCSMTYSVNAKGCTREQAESMFWRYLANVCFLRRIVVEVAAAEL
jgi:ribosomal protein L37AE/L43A